MLRRGCGYALANAGHGTRAIQDWLGHRAIQHTVRYTELAPNRFKDFWRGYGGPSRIDIPSLIAATTPPRSASEMSVRDHTAAPLVPPADDQAPNSVPE